MSLIKRVEKVEALLGMDDTNPGTEVVIIFIEDKSRNAGDPQPVTRFLFHGQAIPREPGELYPAFEIRSIRESLNQLPARMPGQPAPVPVLIGNGSLQE